MVTSRGSINVRARPWASKRQPIDYKRCCTDRLNAHPESRRDSHLLGILSFWSVSSYRDLSVGRL
jgi:hypothetical protein